jgi:hypothetical protein
MWRRCAHGVSPTRRSPLARPRGGKRRCGERVTPTVWSIATAAAPSSAHGRSSVTSTRDAPATIPTTTVQIATRDGLTIVIVTESRNAMAGVEVLSLQTKYPYRQTSSSGQNIISRFDPHRRHAIINLGGFNVAPHLAYHCCSIVRRNNNKTAMAIPRLRPRRTRH